jgi:hypothetical protein
VVGCISQGHGHGMKKIPCALVGVTDISGGRLDEEKQLHKSCTDPSLAERSRTRETGVALLWRKQC